MDLNVAFAIPLKVIVANLDALNTTTTSKKTYWHVHIVEDGNGRMAIPLRGGKQLPIDEFKITIDPEPKGVAQG
jgi:hypothetical protein